MIIMRAFQRSTAKRMVRWLQDKDYYNKEIQLTTNNELLLRRSGAISSHRGFWLLRLLANRTLIYLRQNNRLQMLGYSTSVLIILLAALGCEPHYVENLDWPVELIDSTQSDPDLIIREENCFNKYTFPNPPQCNSAIAQTPTTTGSIIRMVGFDGVGWPMLNVLIQMDLMPNLMRLLCSGTASRLTTDVALTPISVTTIASGKGRHLHGIDTLENTGKSPFLYDKTAVLVPRIWEIMRYHNIPSIIGRYYFTDEGIQRHDEISNTRQQLARKDYGFFITFIQNTDLVQHRNLMPFLLANTPWGANFKFTPFWERYEKQNEIQFRLLFSEMDKIIGEILDEYPNDTLIVYSDHGQHSGPSVIGIRPNVSTLFENVTPSKTPKNTFTVEPGFTVTISEETAEVVLAQEVGSSKTMNLTLILPIITIDMDSGIDSTCTKKAVQSLTRISAEGIPVFQQVSRGVFKLNRHIIPSLIDNPRQLPGIESTDFQIGAHSGPDDGIFIAYGPFIKAGVIAQGYDLLDLVPTVLYLADLPIGRDMKGRVATDFIRRELLDNRPIKYIDSYDPLIPIASKPGQRRTLTPEERARYREIGYPGID